MIQFTKAFKASNDMCYATLEQAQVAELRDVFSTHDSPLEISENVEPFVNLIMLNRDRIIDILTTTESSRPKARKANGGTKKRKAKTPDLFPTSH
jgi:hypothetical protein